MNDLSILMVGCGNMGSALLKGWSQAGLFKQCDILLTSMRPAPVRAENIHVFDKINDLKTGYDIVFFCVKPQVMTRIATDYAEIVKGSEIVVSILAGTPLAFFEGHYGSAQPCVRMMPNTPVAVGQGVCGIVANDATNKASKKTIDKFTNATGFGVWLDSEADINTVTALSGSGPAYVFYMMEAMSSAAQNLGLTKNQADIIARQTVIGAGALANAEGDTTASQLRTNVTSPKGTTEAGLDILMRDENGLKSLMQETISAAAKRAQELAKAT